MLRPIRILVLVAAVLPSGLAAQASGPSGDDVEAIDPDLAPRPSSPAVRASSPVRVDGRLDEEAWTGAPVLDGFIQSQPDRGMPATEPTVVRVVYDDRGLYIGAENLESGGGREVVQSLEHDFPGLSTRDGDIFGVALDTFLDRRNSFIILVNPWGAYRDGQTFNDSRNTDFGWDGVLQVRTTRHERGWTVEMAIPWSTLRFEASDGPQSWGVNFLRRVRWKNEDSYWAPLDRRDPLHRMSRAGTLTGLEGLESSRDLRLKPYVLADDRSGALVDGEVVGSSFDGGLDLKMGLASSLTLDATVNTDFSQVEVDQERVNLTRFPLFFPEQREFFVENSGSFTFGDVTERGIRMGTSLRDFTLFHSRTIGLRDDGSPVPILAGGRVTGSAGAFEVGLMDIRTGEEGGLPGENFAVARLRREVAGAADVGAMLLHRRTVGGEGLVRWNRSWGVDGNARLGSVVLNGYWAGSDDSEAPSDGDRWAGRLSAAFRDRIFDVSAQVRHVGEDFEPGMGFVRRSGVDQAYATAGVHLQPAGWPVQEVAPWVAIDHVDGAEGALLTRRRMAGLDFDLDDGSRLELSWNDRFERVDRPFQPRRGRVVEEGRYGFGEWGVGYTSSTGRPLSGQVRLEGGGYFDGDRRSLTLSARWLASARVALDASAEFNRVELPGYEPFDTDVLGVRAKVGFSTRLFASAYVQVNEATREMVSNVRLNWIHAPLSDLFLVLTERRSTASGGGVLERLVTLKATRLMAF